MRALIVSAIIPLAACNQSTAQSLDPSEAISSAEHTTPPSPSTVEQLQGVDFAAYPAQMYTGERLMPDFNGAEREFRVYRTRLTQGAAQGPNFAGQFALVQIGCGAGCNAIYQIDLARGSVTEITFAPSVVEIDSRADSALLKARWFIQPQTSNGTWSCHYENFVWRDDRLNSLDQAETDGACADDWPPP
jgi:hypothetical protein